MKKILLSAAIAISFSSFAQRTCGVLQNEQFLQQQNPNRAQERAEYEKAIQHWIANNPSAKTNQSTQSTIQIPLVVHMVYSSTADSIGDAQIFSQIQILNDDYTRNNADKVNTPAPFATVAGAPMIQYCWAQRDPSGNATTGIERRKSTTTSWSTDNKVKSFSTGGLNAWDPSRYFNIWVCNLGGGLLGYGEFPTGTLSNTYGFVAGGTCFGNTGLAQAPYNKGRTATHEIGHCFNLNHTWGDGGQCGASDNCIDTPPQKGGTASPAGCNYGTPTYPWQPNTCTRPDGAGGANVTNTNGDMFMNYMDYTDDGAMNMFSANQATRMLAVVNNPPYNALLSSNGCLPLTLPSLDAGIPSVNSPSGTVCSTTFIPIVTLKNWGSATLTSCSIKYKVDAGALQTYSWSGSLASLATTTVALPSTTTTAATHTFSANTASPNGGVDANAANDASSSTFNVAGGALTLPYFEGFESTSAFPFNGITIYNPDAATTWAKSTTAHKTGAGSAYMDNFNYTANKQIDDLILPFLDLTGGTNQQLTFQVAYQLDTDPTSNPNFSDTLQILVSTNCGNTWTSVYKNFGVALTTITPAFSANAFTPTSTQWRLETISLTAYASSNNAMIKFRNITDYENQLYIDDINITATTGIRTEAASVGVLIHPNPSADGKFMVEIKQNQNEVNKLSVYDVLGNKVYEIDQKIPVGQYSMDLSNLSNGTYFVEVIKENKPVFTKIIINK